VEQYYALDEAVPVTGEFGSADAKVWAELLKPDAADTKTLETYGKSNGWLDGQAAVVTRNYGKGTITYVGAWLPDDAMTKLAKWMVETSGVKSEFANVPAGVEKEWRCIHRDQPHQGAAEDCPAIRDAGTTARDSAGNPYRVVGERCSGAHEVG
jgi:hypothetical protein